MTDESEVNGSGRISKTDLLEVSDEPTEAAEGGKESDEDDDEHDPERDLEDVSEGGQRDGVSRPLHVEPVVHQVEAHRQIGRLPHGGMKFNARRRGLFMSAAPNRLSRTVSKCGSQLLQLDEELDTDWPLANLKNHSYLSVVSCFENLKLLLSSSFEG